MPNNKQLPDIPTNMMLNLFLKEIHENQRRYTYEVLKSCIMSEIARENLEIEDVDRALKGLYVICMKQDKPFDLKQIEKEIKDRIDKVKQERN